MRGKLTAIEASATAICAALYAGFGFLAWLGLVCPVVGVVRFWPVVIIPGVFGALFGPLVGGLGAAVGIFISDMAIHGNALLSFLAGVPANFLCFYIVGYLSQREFSSTSAAALGTLGTAIPMALTAILYAGGLLSAEVSIIYTAACLFALACLLASLRAAPRWRGYQVGSVLGLLVGSTWIGVFVWLFSQFFMLPLAVGGGFKLPLYAAAIWAVWVFATEIPFLLALGPPILEACVRAGLPVLARPRELRR